MGFYKIYTYTLIPEYAYQLVNFKIIMKKILFYFTSMQPAGGIERVISTLANKFSELWK